MTTEDQILRIVLRFGLDQPTATEARAGVDSVTTALKATQAQAASAETELRKLRMVARELNQVAMLTIGAGTAIAGPFIAAAAKYVSAMGTMDQTSSHWLLAMDSISRSTDNIGRVAATILLPGLEQAAGLAKKVADYLEQNPGVVEAALKIGATVIAIGTVEKAVADGIKFYADVNLILAAATQNTAADKMLLAANIQAGAAGASGGGGAAAGAAGVLGALRAAAGTAIAISVVAMAATAIGVAVASAVSQGVEKLIRPAQDPRFQGMGWTDVMAAGQANNAAAAALASRNNPADQYLDQSDRDRTRNQPGSFIPNSPELNYSLARTAAQPAYNAYAKSSASLDTGNIAAVGGENRAYQLASLTAETDHNATRLRMVADFNQQETQIEKSYNDTRRLQIRDFNEQSKQLESSYNQSRLRAIRNFAEQQATAAESFNDSQTKALESHNTEMARLAADHATALAAAADTHNQTLRDLAARGDALGFVKEKESYAKSTAAAEKAYTLEVARKNQDFDKARSDAQTNYDESRKQAQAAFKQSQDDAKTAYDDQKAQRVEQFAQTLSDAATAYQDQKNQRADQHQNQMDDEATQYFEIKTKRDSQHTDHLAQLAAQYLAQKTALTAAFTDQLNAIDPILTGMTKSVQTNMQNASDEFAKYLVGVVSQIGGGPGYCGPGYHWDAQTKSCVIDTQQHNYGGRSAAGGYVGYGLRLLGEQGREFVLNNSTMSAAERLTGGPLTQDKILASLGAHNSFNVNLGGISASWGDKASALEGVLGIVDARITSAFDQFATEMGA